MALDVGKTEAASKAYQKLLHEMSELKESLRLERSRNADTDRKCAMGSGHGVGYLINLIS